MALCIGRVVRQCAQRNSVCLRRAGFTQQVHDEIAAAHEVRQALKNLLPKG